MFSDLFSENLSREKAEKNAPLHRIKQLISMIYKDSCAVLSLVAVDMQDHGILKRSRSIRKPVKAATSKQK